MKELGKMLVKSGLPIRRTSHDERPPETSNFDSQSVTQTPVSPAPYSRLSRRRHPSGTQTNPDASLEKVPEKQNDSPGSVYQELDSWKPKYRAPASPGEPDIADMIEGLMSKEEFEALRRTGRKPFDKPRKKRNVCMTMSVSEEEAELLRRYPASLDLTFSEWARSVLFSSMGKKLPKRPGNPKS